MAIQIMGTGDLSKVTIDFIGDGVAMTRAVDLGAPPFNFNWGGRYPGSDQIARVIDGPTPSSQSINNAGVVTFNWDAPLPAPNPGTLSPRTKLELYLLY